MGVEKESSKGGGYVGGFFQLFDWKAKSRKKLFSSKLDIPERSKQGKRSDGNLPATQFHLMDDDDNGFGQFVRGSNDYSCASSMTDEDGYGTKAPGVVARLMGLDSLPTLNFSEPSSTPFFDTQSLQDASQRRRHVEFYRDDPMMYSGHILHKDDGFSRNLMEPRPQKLIIRPIEKFQTEMLPPKSAKSIPVTHHKLLSPIKSPGFIPSKTAAHIMEAAARIIEPSPQVAAKVPIVRSSSAPLKVRDLKEKLEVAQKTPGVGSSSKPLKARDVKEKVENTHRTSRPVEASQRKKENNSHNFQSNASKYLKGQPLNRSWNGSVDATSFQSLTETEEGSSGSKSKGKSISLAVQAKVNVQRREGLSLSSSQGFLGHKEKNEVILSQPYKSQPNAQKSSNKNFTNGSSVLRQNNQKQNCQKEKDVLPSKPPLSSLHSRRLSSGGPVRHKTSGKTVGSEIGLRKLASGISSSKREISNNALRNTPRKKRSINDNSQSKKSQDVDGRRKTIESNPVVDVHFSFSHESKKEGMDVVSFTFTAPLARSITPSEPSSQVVQKNNGACLENRGKRLLLDSNGTKLSSPGYDVLSGDDLNALLEKKLKALSSNVVSPYFKSVEAGSTFSSMSSLQDPIPSLNLEETPPRLLDNKEHHAIYANSFGSGFNSDVFATENSDAFSTDSTGTGAFGKHIIQGACKMEDWSSSMTDSGKQLDCRPPSSVSVLETLLSTESSNSLDSTDSSCTEANKPCSFIQGQEVLGSSTKKFHYVDAEMELSDSASSASIGILNGETSSEIVANTQLAANWESDYVKQILNNFDWMFQDFVLSRSQEVVSPHLFNQLENKKYLFESYAVETKQERKLLFDSVSECLDSRCTQYLGGGYRTWAKGMSVVTRKDWLLDEVQKEITIWKGMRDCNVDELVFKDMSTPNGSWREFEFDACLLGAELGSQILNSLVNEVVADMLLSRR